MATEKATEAASEKKPFLSRFTPRQQEFLKGGRAVSNAATV